MRIPAIGVRFFFYATKLGGKSAVPQQQHLQPATTTITDNIPPQSDSASILRTYRLSYCVYWQHQLFYEKCVREREREREREIWLAKGRYSVGNAARSPKNRKRGSLDRNLDRTLRPFSIFDRKTINAVVLLGNLDIDNFAEARGRTLRRRGPSSRRSNSTAAKKES